MSSVSSFVCISDIDSTDDATSEWSHISAAIEPPPPPQQPRQQQQELKQEQKDDDENELKPNSVSAVEQRFLVGTNHDDDDDFCHLSEAERSNADNVSSTGWSQIQPGHRLFDVRSVDSEHSARSVDTVRAHFVFNDFAFNSNHQRNKSQRAEHSSGSKWIWLKGPSRPKSKRSQRRKQRAIKLHSLCVIDEDGEIENEDAWQTDQEDREGEEEKTILDIKDLNEFIESTINLNPNTRDLINLCNQICRDGILKVGDIEIELCEAPLFGMKLRDIFFRKLVLLQQHDIDRDMHAEQKYVQRREIWLRLSWNARIYLCPFGSFEEFRALYNVHASVKCNEFLAVIDKESFEILTRAEWIRVVLFKSYLAKIRSLHYLQRQEFEAKNQEQMSEIRSLLMIGNFNGHAVNFTNRYKQKQLSLIFSTKSKQESASDSVAAFDAMERQIESQLRLESEMMETVTAMS